MWLADRPAECVCARCLCRRVRHGSPIDRSKVWEEKAIKQGAPTVMEEEEAAPEPPLRDTEDSAAAGGVVGDAAAEDADVAAGDAAGAQTATEDVTMGSVQETAEEARAAFEAAAQAAAQAEGGTRQDDDDDGACASSRPHMPLVYDRSRVVDEDDDEDLDGDAEQHATTAEAASAAGDAVALSSVNSGVAGPSWAAYASEARAPAVHLAGVHVVTPREQYAGDVGRLCELSDAYARGANRAEAADEAASSAAASSTASADAASNAAASSAAASSAAASSAAASSAAADGLAADGMVAGGVAWRGSAHDPQDGLTRGVGMAMAWMRVPEDEGSPEHADETEWARQKQVEAAAKAQHTRWLRNRFRARLEAEKVYRSLRFSRGCMLTWAGTLVSQDEAREMLRSEFGVCVCVYGCEYCRA
jgi:hypothetical protein